MKKQLVYTMVLFLLFTGIQQRVAAQVYLQRDCYKSYKSQGDSYKAKGYYDLAVQQYKNAKNCGKLSRAQIKELDSLIADANRRVIKTRVITRRY
jgi:hypothetical protein